MRMMSQITIADVLRCRRTLDTKGDAALAVMGKLLGFEIAPVQVSPNTDSERPLPLEPKPLEPWLGKPIISEPKLPGTDSRLELGPPPLPVTENRRGGKRPAEWDGPPLPAFDPTIHDRPPLIFDPLFLPIWTRAIISATLATPRPSGQPDVPRIVRFLAQQQVMERLPQRFRQSLSLGVQILIDLGDGMAPFRRDQFDLAKRIRATVGSSLCEILYFQNCPIRGAGHSGVWSWRRYRPPVTGRPVLVLSDLSISPIRTGAVQRDEWRTWGQELTLNGNPLIAFVPYPPDRWPRALDDTMMIVQWDRSTTARELFVTLRHKTRKPSCR